MREAGLHAAATARFEAAGRVEVLRLARLAHPQAEAVRFVASFYEGPDLEAVVLLDEPGLDDPALGDFHTLPGLPLHVARHVLAVWSWRGCGLVPADDDGFAGSVFWDRVISAWHASGCPHGLAGEVTDASTAPSLLPGTV